MRKLGDNQRSVLVALADHGRWYAGCGWIWDGNSGTVRILDTLIRRRLVVRRNRWQRRGLAQVGRPIAVYTLTLAGRRTVENM